MKTLLARRRRAVASEPVPSAPTTPAGGATPEAPIASARGQVGAALTTKAIWAALVACLVAGPVGLALGAAAIATAPTPTPAAAPVAERSNARTAAGAMGEHVVATWLGASRDAPGQLAALVPAASTTTLPVQATAAFDYAVASVVDDGGVFSVTVAATVAGPTGQAVRAYYAVAMTITDGPPMTFSVLALPAAVAAPQNAAAPALAYSVSVEPSSALAVTVEQFLAAYAAGDGDVTRYTAPGSAITAITPAPYTGLSVQQVRATAAASQAGATPADGQVAHVLASATATRSPEQSLPLSYALSLEARAGRWEVASIDSAPQLRAGAAAPQQSTATPAPGGTP